MHRVRYIVTWCHRCNLTISISAMQYLHTLHLAMDILPLLLHSFIVCIVQATLCHGVSYAHSSPHLTQQIQWPSLPAPAEPVDKDDSSSSLVAAPEVHPSTRVFCTLHSLTGHVSSYTGVRNVVYKSALTLKLIKCGAFIYLCLILSLLTSLHIYLVSETWHHLYQTMLHGVGVCYY